MDPGGYGGAFGGGKAGGAQDPLLFLKKPPVVIRLSALLFSIIVFGSISSQGWSYDSEKKKDVCVMNKSAATCHFATFVGVIGFLGAIGLLVGEWFFEQMSSIKTRKHYVVADLGFSGVWAVFYLMAFCAMSASWSKAGEEFKFAAANIYGAIFFAFVSIFSWGGAAFFAYQRFKAGSDGAFAQGLGDEDAVGPDGTYQSYPGGADDGQYSEPPFNNAAGGGGQAGMNYTQQVQY